MSEKKFLPAADAQPPGERLVDLMTGFGPVYLDISRRQERSSVQMNGRKVCGDPELAGDFKHAEDIMNGLLEDYFAFLTTEVALEGIPHKQIVADHAEQQLEMSKAQE